MKKIILLVILSIMSILVLVSCGNNNSAKTEDAIKVGETLTLKQLAQKAYDESNGKTFTYYTNTSRVKDAISGNAKKEISGFVKFVQTLGPNYSNYSLTVDQRNPKDGNIYGHVHDDHNASFAVIQDAFQLKTKSIDTGDVLNFIPKELKEVQGFDEAQNGNPLALQDNIKVFMYNNTNGEKMNNVWDYVLNNHPFVMPYDKETVGKNLLIMMTKKEYADIMKKAYDALDASKKALVDAQVSKITDDFLTQNGFDKTTNPNVVYALAFGILFTSNANYSKPDDSDILGALDQKGTPGNGLLVYSKLRTIKETDKVSAKNISVSAYNEGYQGVGGFSYKHYLTIPKDSPLPYTAMAIIAYITLTKDGYKVWNEDLGDYSSNPTLTKDRSNYGGTEFPVKNDKGYDWWFSKDDGKGRLVVEDLNYLAKHKKLSIYFEDIFTRNK